MKRLPLALGLIVAPFGFSACKKQVNENDAIRAGILQHLTSIGTLNMSAMDMDVRSVSINANQAHAEVEFRPKSGGTPGAGRASSRPSAGQFKSAEFSAQRPGPDAPQ